MKAVVLASGGLDSAVTAAMAKRDGNQLYLLTLEYGQRHHIEITRAQRIAEWLEACEHKVVRLDLSVFGQSALTDEIAVPKNRSVAQREDGIPCTYVPARNTIFLSLALAYAEVVQAEAIFIGANIRDYSGYPDCRPEFLKAFSEVGRLGTKRGVEGCPLEVKAPLLMMTKADIIRQGQDLQVPFEWTHSCYDPHADGLACGQCDSCLIRLEGFREVGMKDPVDYVPGIK
ncbi:MAG: 7-cyano-7-deazaguanine synthase QueC [Nitrospirota bacterium]|nr:7-cyano-7-deazaguanine synthase QueC [Nitrospirota bacterium]